MSKSFDDFAIDRLKHLRNAPSDVLNADGSHLSHRFSEYCEAVESICGPAPFQETEIPLHMQVLFAENGRTESI